VLWELANFDAEISVEVRQGWMTPVYHVVIWIHFNKILRLASEENKVISKRQPLTLKERSWRRVLGRDQ
jgi:hypothetical protein